MPIAINGSMFVKTGMNNIPSGMFLYSIGGGMAMRTNEEIMALILSIAQADPRILAVGLQGSRSRNVDVDRYSDFDVVYVVSSLRPFLNDKAWIHRFGEILIVQQPDDWYDHPFDSDTMFKFTWLMQFTDFSRIDLTLVQADEPSLAAMSMKLLLDKTGCFLNALPIIEDFSNHTPLEKEVSDTVN
ncbi:MAG: hypothetical protein E4G74_00825 [Erysipelotrichales bacterium]|nr:MAG: hypothetical protein E4G74_00825 [Erysipelotrichales bacterium]